MKKNPGLILFCAFASISLASCGGNNDPVDQFYTVSFKNYDSTLLSESKVKEGETAIYNGPRPVREETNEYTYTFTGWDQPLENITSDCIRVAQYRAEAKPQTIYYTVTFKNFDGSILNEARVEEGGTAVYGGVTPSRPDTPEFTYTHTGWDLPLTNITSNCIRVAQYSETYKEYTVEFYSYNNVLLETDTVHYQQAAHFTGLTPTKPGTATHHYVFKEWDKDITCITKSISVHPLFNEYGNEKHITLDPNNGQSSQAIDVIYDEAYDLGTPTFPGFNFLGWYDGETRVETSGTWTYSGISSLTAKWESVYFEFASDGASGYTVSLTTQGKSASEVIVPSVYNGVTITTLASAFSQSNTNITKVTIPGTIKSIPDSAFRFCSKLSELILKDGITSIGAMSFDTCALTKLDIPSSVTSIGNYAFDENNKLYQVFIPDSVKTIGSAAFETLNSDAYVCTSHVSKPSGWSSTWSGAQTYFQCTKIVDDEDFTYIVQSDYGDESATIVRLNDKTKQNFTFPSELGDITDIRVGRRLFYQNLYLRTLNLNQVTSVGPYAFYGCTKLNTITFSNRLKTIGTHSFQSCTALTSISIPESVTTIEEQAFDSCSGLTYIYIPKTVTKISAYAFDVCNKSTIYTNAHTANSGWASNWKGSQPIFYDFVSLSDVDDFNYVVQSYLNQSYVTITSLKASAKEKTSLIVPDEIEGINDIRLANSLFNGLGELLSVDLGSGVKVVPQYCFANCSKLQTVTLHEGVTSLGQYAFNQCTKLTSINMPSTLTSIGGQCFDYCYALREIVIPASVSSIGAYAFDETNKMALLVEANTAQSGWNSNWRGTSTSNKQFIYGYKSSGTSGYFRYAKSYDGENYYINVLSLTNEAPNEGLVMPNEIEGITNIKIMNLAFDGNSLLKNIDLGSSVIYIGEYAFRNNTSLRSVIIPSSCLTIQNYAFNGCSTQCTLKCEASEKPSGWGTSWNNSNCQVEWGYTR